MHKSRPVRPETFSRQISASMSVDQTGAAKQARMADFRPRHKMMVKLGAAFS